MYEIKYRKPEEMKDSGVEWLGRIPEEWKVKTLKHLATIVTGNTPPKNDTSNYENGSISWIKPDNIQEDFSISVTEDKLSNKGLKNARLIPKGSAIVCCIGTVGKVGFNKVVSTTNQQINSIIFNKKDSWLSKFGMYAMIASKNEHEKKANKVVVAILNKTQQGNIKMVCPNITEQQKIANFLDTKTTQFNAIISKKEKLIEKLEEAKKSLISEVVTGKVKIVDGQMVKRKPEEMKDSGVKWLGMIPKEWEVKKLKYLANKIGSGKTPRGGSEIYVEEGIPFLRSQNVYNDGLRLEDVVFINEKTNHEMSNTKVKYNDILLNITGASIGRCAMFLSKEKEANVNQHVCIIRLKKDIKNEKFYLFAIQSKLVQEQILSQQIGSSREGLNFEQIANFLFIIPRNDKEKEEIVAFLNKKDFNINITINKIQTQIQKLKEAKQALISEAVTGKIDLQDWEIIEEEGGAK